jgi:hypothetical protein
LLHHHTVCSVSTTRTNERLQPVMRMLAHVSAWTVLRLLVVCCL